MGQIMRFKGLWATGAAIAVVAAATAPAFAQQITANVRGTITDAAGAPLTGASITVTDTRTNFSTSTSTGAAGQFNLSGLETGGPYSVTIAAEGFQVQRLDGLLLSLGDTSTVSVALNPADDSEEIVVVAARDRTTRLAIGPNVVFGTETIEGAPTITRDIRDVLRFDPRLVVTANAAGSQQNVSCLGGNNRSNVFTIDGVASGDTFGLNASAFQGRFGNPYPFGATKQISVEYAPFDVQYANFSGCAINVVTKTGSNEYHGSGFGEYTSDGLSSSQIEGRDLTRAPFRAYRWGADFSGALIKDRVFFYVGYEQQILPGNPVSIGPAGLGFGTSQNFVTPAIIDEVAQRIQSVYGYDPGGVVRDVGYTTRRILTHWTFVLSDKHKLDFTYNRFREANEQADDGPSTSVFAFGGNFQTQGTSSETYSARLFSQWTDDLSTELRVSRADVQDIQNPLGGGEAQTGSPIVRIQIGVQNDLNGNGRIDSGGSNFTSEQGVLLAGPGFSRSANDLRTQLDQIRGVVKYNYNRHAILAGFDWNQLDAFNLFVQNATGTLTFTSLSNFRNNIINPLGTSTAAPNAANIFDLTTGGLAGISAQGRGSQSITGAAAAWSRAIFSGYGQDSWTPTDNLTINLGLRYDRYVSGATPQLNGNFVRRYGFNNSQTFQNLQLFQPRLAVKYEFDEGILARTGVTFGAGVFGGGDPSVFFSNAFSNTGGSFISAQSTSTGGTTCTPAQLAGAYTGGVFTGLPACIINAQNAGLSGALDGPVNAVDPNLKLASVVRANLEIKHQTDFGGFAGGFFDDWGLTVSYIHSAFRNQYRFLPLSQFAVGVTSIGFPRYLTVDPLNAGCGLRFNGLDQGFSGTYSTLCNGSASRNGDILLTNTRNGSGDSDSLAFLAAKRFEYALGTAASEFDVNIGYAFTNATDASNNGATTAASGVTSTTITGPLGELNVAPGGFFNGHNVTFQATSRHEFFENFATKLTAFFQARSGQRFSYTSTGGNFAPGLNSSSIFSFYVPAGGQTTLGAFTPGTANAASVNGQFLRAGTFATNDPNVAIAGVVRTISATSLTPFAGANPAAGVVTGGAFVPFDVTAFNAFLAQSGLSEFAGEIAPRNRFLNDWFLDLDLRFSQEIPTPVKGLRLEAYSTLNNFLNLLRREGNIFRGFGNSTSVVGLSNLPAVTNTSPGTAQPVVYQQFFNGNTSQAVNDSLSAWQVNFGLRFEF